MSCNYLQCNEIKMSCTYVHTSISIYPNTYYETVTLGTQKVITPLKCFSQACIQAYVFIFTKSLKKCQRPNQSSKFSKLHNLTFAPTINWQIKLKGIYVLTHEWRMARYIVTLPIFEMTGVDSKGTSHPPSWIFSRIKKYACLTTGHLSKNRSCVHKDR